MNSDGLREAAVEVMTQPIKHICKIVGAVERDLAGQQLDALLALLDRRGFAVVPKVATEEMLRAGFSRFLPWGTSIELWRDQLTAAPNPFAEAPDGQ